MYKNDREVVGTYNANGIMLCWPDQRATRPKKSMEDKVSKLFEGLSPEQVAQVLKNAGLKEA